MSLLSALRELRRRWDQASLEYDLAHGRRPYGRGRLDASPRLLEEVIVPMEAQISAKVIRADGTVEDQGVVSTTKTNLTGEQVAKMHAASRRQRGGSSR